MTALFSPRFKLAVHLIQLILVHAVLIIAGVRMLAFSKEVNFGSRGNTIALGMGTKSLVIIFYQILTEHFKFFKRWHSFKANAILNSLEIIFWGAVCFLMIQANIQRCLGTSCILSWVTVSISVILVFVAVWMAFVTIIEFKEYRRKGSLGRRHHMRTQSSGESGYQLTMHQVRRK